ncbi:DUF4411 family protein [Hydrogenobacter sp. T-2]|uniref:DUF4411 family protein n=1 Tax=Pampinifervens diazotrophicum TaxID=1632018 RepID=UPI002B25B8C4|nr:DUF4411 family protein [Hydrogenobacter sp. T-2]WPM32906.1 DUF4411 family protein [Hydrogenobacter sp. T-2]
MSKVVYIVDTSALIDLKDKYPMDIFEGLWKEIEKLCKFRRFIAPEEVRKEIRDDGLIKWLRKSDMLFISPDSEQVEKVKEILSKHISLAKEEGKANADPWLIALAIVRVRSQLFKGKHVILTQESKTKANRIPAVAKEYGIECYDLIELFRSERWKF